MNHIHGDKFQEFADVYFNEYTKPNDIPEKIDLLVEQNCLIFCKTDFVFGVFDILTDIQKNIPERKYVLMTHNSDYAIDETYWNRKPDNVLRWFALNVDFKTSNLIPLPSGMERPLGGGYSSNYGVIENQLKHSREYKNLCYMNFNENNNHEKRDGILEYFKDFPWVTYRKLGVSFPDYIQNCYNHNFVFAPMGNGIDTHRMWETLYLGNVPIVQLNLVTNFFRDLPILIVEDYTILTEEYLKYLWDEFKEATKYKLDKISMDYWKDRILQDKEKLFND